MRNTTGSEIDGVEVAAHLVDAIPTVIGISQSELTLCIATPALDCIADYRTDAVNARIDRLRVGTQRNGRQSTWIIDIHSVALTELTVVVVAPANQIVVVENGTGDVLACSNLCRGSTCG